MGLIKYISEKFREEMEKSRRSNEAYAQMYRDIWTGTPEEVELKLARWDYVHEVTRPRAQHRSFI